MTGETLAGQPPVHPAWLPDDALAALGRRRVAVVGDGPLVATVREEVTRAVGAHGGALTDAVDAPEGVDLLLAITPWAMNAYRWKVGFLI